MVAKVLKTSEAGKHTEVTALVYDHDHLYTGGSDGVINVWDKDLIHQRTIPVHKDFPVIALAVNAQNQLYSCGRDGSLRHFKRPWHLDQNDIWLQTVSDDITALYVVDNTLYSGDDKGIVTKWYHNQVGSQYNAMEEVRSMAVEGLMLYTVRETDVLITDITPRQLEGFSVKATIPGRFPLVLLGSIVEGHKKWLAAGTRDGKGLVLIDNKSPYKVLWTKENAHEMLINVAIANESSLFTAGWDGKVKRWVDLAKGPKVAEEVSLGKCINALCFGPDNTVYAGLDDGKIVRVEFSA